MTSLKGLFLTAILALLIYSLQNTDGQRCNKKKYFCPNTTVTLDTSNPVIFREAQRNLTLNILSSPLMSNNISPRGKDFVAYIIKRLNTDSPSELLGYYIFSFWSIIYLSSPNDYLSLCPIASFVNASNIWATAREPTAMVNSLLQLSNSGYFLCTMVQVTSLTQLGCENIPQLPGISSRCYQFGKVYQIEQALDLFGRSLPCCVLEKLYALYSSTKYSDNVLAAFFTLSLSPLIRTLMTEHNTNMLIETFNMLIFNNVSICCCSKRNQRFNEMCIAHSGLFTQNINTMINNTILFDECATEPHVG